MVGACHFGIAPKQRSCNTTEVVKIGRARRREDSVVVRMVIDTRFAQQWRQTVAKPAQQARAWLHEAIPKARTEVYDMWGFELHTAADGAQAIRGLARVSQASFAKELMNHSGALHGGDRWFIQPMGMELEGAVRWIPWDGKGTWSDYAGRLRNDMGQGQGIVLGKYQLGVRVSATEAAKNPTTTHWTMEGAPPFLHIEDAESLIKATGFHDIEILTKGRRAWTFRASRRDIEELVQTTAEDGDGEQLHLVFTKSSRKRRTAWGQVTPLRTSPVQLSNLEPYGKSSGKGHGATTTTTSSTRLTQPHKASTKTDSPAGVSTSEGTKEPQHMDVDGQGDAQQHGKRKATETESTNKSALRGFDHWGYGGRKHRNDGGGNCLFLAVAHQLEILRPNERKRSHRQIREFTHAYLNKSKDKWSRKWDNTDAKGKATTASFDDFLTELRKVGTWAGAYELNVLAEALKVKVLVATSWGEVKEFNHEAKEAITLYYDYGAAHWESVSEVDIQAWYKIKATE